MRFSYQTILAALSLSLTLSSCDDFLDITPLNEIVETNYWTEKADVESVLNSCYSRYEEDGDDKNSTKTLRRMFVWGEVRSDNVTTGRACPLSLSQVIGENILETNEWLKWEDLYQIINRCNVVIKYAPIVGEKDPNYTPSEVKANIAEATFLRSLAYFYLVRTFRDIPYVTTPSDTDDDIDGRYRIAPTPFDQVLTHLAEDLEAVQGDALRLYPEDQRTGKASNTSRVTTCAIYALLADIYLWKGEYQRCCEYCDLVFQYKYERYEELLEEEPDEAANLELYDNKYMLLKEQPSGNTMGAVYNEIFGNGNSFESIFEFYYKQNMSPKNILVSKFFGKLGTEIGYCSAYSGLYSGVKDKTNTLFHYTDCRAYENMADNNGAYPIKKYVSQRATLTFKGDQMDASSSQRSDEYANWIIYRYTDVMLMKAEAEVEMGQDKWGDAFHLVSLCYNRANNFTAASADTLNPDNYNSLAGMRELVLDERRRELMFEGKRWFDLVRFSLRTGDNTYLVNTCKQKQKERQTAIALQLSDQNALFWPYHETELDANPNLTQNSAYITNETSQK